MFFLFSARILIGFQFLISVLPKFIFSRSHEVIFMCYVHNSQRGAHFVHPFNKVSVLVEFVIDLPFVRLVRENL